MNISKTSIDSLYDILIDPCTTIEVAEITGLNIWSRGLRIHGHMKRVEKDLAEASKRRGEFGKINFGLRTRKRKRKKG